jgi:hypothetical protein
MGKSFGKTRTFRPTRCKPLKRLCNKRLRKADLEGRHGNMIKPRQLNNRLIYEGDKRPFALPEDLDSPHMSHMRNAMVDCYYKAQRK